MSEIGKLGPEIVDSQKLDMTSVIAGILPRGHVVHGYSSANNVRIVAILESREYSANEPLLGFGMDGQAERALGRALLTYGLRERDGLRYFDRHHYPESTIGMLPTGDHKSKFDNIVWNAGFKLYQDGQDIVAHSSFGGVLDLVEVRAGDALSAIVGMTDEYQFTSPRINSLPAISFE